MAWLAKLLPLLVAILTALAGLFPAAQAVGSHFEITNAMKTTGLAAGDANSLYAMHVYGNGALSAGIIALAAFLSRLQPHVNQWKAAFDKLSHQEAASIAKVRAILEAQEKRATVVEQVHDLPAGELAKVVDRVGHQIADTVKRLAGA